MKGPLRLELGCIALKTKALFGCSQLDWDRKGSCYYILFIETESLFFFFFFLTFRFGLQLINYPIKGVILLNKNYQNLGGIERFSPPCPQLYIHILSKIFLPLPKLNLLSLALHVNYFRLFVYFYLVQSTKISIMITLDGLRTFGNTIIIYSLSPSSSKSIHS